ncbi:hypothetical protein OG21DRAFT_1527514 [Imleria badia]|nr:hypothetical protein OG21DRAFT_1527514 [Imleria badia]
MAKHRIVYESDKDNVEDKPKKAQMALDEELPDEDVNPMASSSHDIGECSCHTRQDGPDEVAIHTPDPWATYPCSVVLTAGILSSNTCSLGTSSTTATSCEQCPARQCDPSSQYTQSLTSRILATDNLLQSSQFKNSQPNTACFPNAARLQQTTFFYGLPLSMNRSGHSLFAVPDLNDRRDMQVSLSENNRIAEKALYQGQDMVTECLKQRELPEMVTIASTSKEQYLMTTTMTTNPQATGRCIRNTMAKLQLRTMTTTMMTNPQARCLCNTMMRLQLHMMTTTMMTNPQARCVHNTVVRLQLCMVGMIATQTITTMMTSPQASCVCNPMARLQLCRICSQTRGETAPTHNGGDGAPDNPNKTNINGATPASQPQTVTHPPGDPAPSQPSVPVYPSKNMRRKTTEEFEKNVVAIHCQQNRALHLPSNLQLQQPRSTNNTRGDSEAVNNVDGQGCPPTNLPVGSVMEHSEPWQLQYYDPPTCDVIKHAKQFSHCDAASINPFPICTTFNTKAIEYINKVISKRRAQGLIISDGWWPNNASSITKLVTWVVNCACDELLKATVTCRAVSSDKHSEEIKKAIRTGIQSVAGRAWVTQPKTMQKKVVKSVNDVLHIFKGSSLVYILASQGLQPKYPKPIFECKPELWVHINTNLPQKTLDNLFALLAAALAANIQDS